MNFINFSFMIFWTQNISIPSISYPHRVEINIYTFMPSGNINTVPINVNLYAQWLPQSCQHKHTPSGNRDTESVITHIGIHSVTIPRQLLAL